MNVIPAPRSATKREGRCVLPETIGVDLGGFCEYATTAFSERVKRGICNGEFIKLVRDESFDGEEYCLDVDENSIEIKASSERGVIWALTTLVNLLDNGEAECVRIEDKPRYAHRGLNLDCVRHFFPVEEVKKIIEAVSLAKINVLHWHLTDDQGWRIESKKFPRLNEVSGSYFRQEEIKEVVRYAKERGVEVIPEIDMPGHMTALLSAFPEYGCFGKEVQLATCGGIYPVILCAGKEKTFDVVDGLLGEILPLFESERVHIGGDEAPKSEWKKCPDCNKKMEELGLSSYNDLQGYFTSRVCDILKKYGKRAICWNETLLANNYPKDITVQYWTLNHRKSMEKFVKGGGKWIYSEMFDFYLDYPHSMISLERMYGARARFGKRDCSDNKNLAGMECCMWTEQVAESERLENLLFPRVLALAEIAWSEKRDYKDFESRLKKVAKSEAYRDVRFTGADMWNPKGRARRKDAVDFLYKVRKSISREVQKQSAEASKPSAEFSKNFITKFMRMSDIPALLKMLTRK